MKALFARYGGHLMRIGKGKASNQDLPEDQSLDNMLDTKSEEIIKNVYVISSYDLMPSYMSPLKSVGRGLIKLGRLEHKFTDMSIDAEITLMSSIYITFHEYLNCFAVIIKTHKDGMKYIMDDYYETYDYVLTTKFSYGYDEEKYKLFTNPKLIEIMLLILFFKMEITYYPFEFTPSKTHLGKKISPSFIISLNSFYKDINSIEDLSLKMKGLYEN